MVSGGVRKLEITTETINRLNAPSGFLLSRVTRGQTQSQH